MRTPPLALALAALLFGCVSAAMPSLPHAPPPWASEIAVWCDPSGPAVGVGTSPERSAKAAQLLTQRLVADGFRRGAANEPGTLVIRSSVNTAPGNFAMASELLRDGQRLDTVQITSGQLPCWSAVRSPDEATECAVSGLADRIEDSPALAAAHQKPASARPQLTGRLAVLDLRNETKDLAPKDVRYFTDVIRAAVLKLLPKLEVMTRENLLVLLQASGKELANCEGECEVDTGRRIGADAIISGELVKIGSRYKLSMRLHDTHDGRLQGAAVASGATIDELDESANRAVSQLLLGGN